MSKPDREKKLDRDHPQLSIRRQCRMLALARSGVYRQRKGPDEAEFALMRRIDELFLAHPFLGARRIAAMLRNEGLTRHSCLALVQHDGYLCLPCGA
jgi:putative transposase